MKKIVFRNKLLALLISSNIVLTGCSIKSEIKTDNEQNIFDDTTITYDSTIENNMNINSNLNNESSEIEKDIVRIDTDKRINESIKEEYVNESETSINNETESKKEEFIDEFEIDSENKIDSNIYEYDYIYTDDNYYIRANETVNVRYEPNTESDIMDILYEGNSLKKIGTVGNWYMVECNDETGYVSKDYTEEIEQSNINNDTYNDIYGSNVCCFPYGATIYSDKELTNAIADIPSLESGLINYQVGDVYSVDTYGYNGYVSIYSVSIIQQPVIIVDKSEQMLRLYKNNNLTMEFPVVTGNETDGFYNPSDEGLFNIYSKEYDANLVGPTWNVNVNVFMAYNGGEGIHDATWRTYFGGECYLGDGSHGCINCPYYEVMALADEVDVGDRVLVKR